MANEPSPDGAKSPDFRWHAATSGPGAAQSAGGGHRRARTAILFGVLLALVSLVVVWIIIVAWVSSGPYFLAFTVAGYDARQWPVPAFANQDWERLKRHFPQPGDARTKTKTVLEDHLRELITKKGGYAGGPLVVHITAQALVRENKVYLLPAEARPDRPEGWVSVDFILQALTDCHERKLLLILDLAHPGRFSDPKLQDQHDRVAEVLEQELTKSPPAFFVLLPCSKGQFSRTSEVWQCSALAYYLDRGLQGDADGWDPDGKISSQLDKIITVRGLYAFAKSRVDRWSQIHYGEPQQPLLLFHEGEVADFPLADLRRNPPPERYEPAARGSSYPSTLQKGWEARDKARLDGNLGPAQVIQALEKELLLQEERWQSGANPDEPVAEITRARDALKQRERPPLARLFLQTALAREQQNVELATSLFELLENVAEKKGKVEWMQIEKTLDSEIKKHKGADFPVRAWAVVQALSRYDQLPVEGLQENQVRLALAALGSTPPGAGYVETFYLQRLDDYSRRLSVRFAHIWTPGPAQRLYKTMRTWQAVLVALGQDPSLFPQAKKLIEQADNTRQKAETELLWYDPRESLSDADDALKQAEKTYASVLNQLAARGRCQQVVNELCVILPGYVPLLSDWPEHDARTVETWHEARATLVGHLGDPAARAAFTLDARLDQMEARCDELDRYLRKLKTILSHRIQEAEKAKSARGLEQMHCLLRSPLLTAKERVSLHEKATRLADALTRETEQQEQENARQPAKIIVPGVKQQAAWGAAERVRVRDRWLHDLAELELAMQKVPDLLAPKDQGKEFIRWLANRYEQEGRRLSKNRPLTIPPGAPEELWYRGEPRAMINFFDQMAKELRAWPNINP